MSGLVIRGALTGAVAAVIGLLATSLAIKAGAEGSGWIVVVAVAALLGAVAGSVALLRSGMAVGEVTNAAGKLGEGNFDARVGAPYTPVGELSHGFNSMAARVQQLFEEKASEHARLDAIFAASTDAMVALAPNITVRYINPAAGEIFGIDPAAAIGRPFIETARDYELDALVRRAVVQPRGQRITGDHVRCAAHTASRSRSHHPQWR